VNIVKYVACTHYTEKKEDNHGILLSFENPNQNNKIVAKMLLTHRYNDYKETTVSTNRE
jgi:hypothetical protein